MLHKQTKNRATRRCILGASILMSSLFVSPSLWAADSLGGALTEGKPTVNARVRLETVAQDNALKDASAQTLRVRAGYQTAPYNGLSVLVEVEGTTGSGDFNSSANKKTTFSKVIDPSVSDVNRAVVTYQADKNKVKAGRQRIKIDNDRFVGNVGWRQNEQTFGAAYWENGAMIQDTEIKYAYISNINNIKGKNVGSASNILNLGYTGLGAGKLTGYAYMIKLLETNGTQAADESFNSVGVRFKGAAASGESNKLLYTLEYASQSHMKDVAGADTQSASYTFAEGGYQIKGVATLKGSYEVLGGDGTYGFQTPLATKHAFNGWSDQFLSTPTAGLKDTFVTVATKVAGVKLKVIQHNFATDSGGDGLGSELDFVAVKKIGKPYKVVLKYASYTAGDTGSYVDTNKLWLQGEAKF